MTALRLQETTPTVLLPRLTALVVLLTINGDPGRLAFAVVVVGMGVAAPRLLSDGRLWLAVGAVMAVWNVVQWHAVDNHIFLANYWYLALGLSLLSSDATSAMAANARALITIAFGFAVAWKVISPDFLSGDFFEFTLLTDARFEGPARVAGVTSSALSANRQLLASGAGGTLATSGNITAFSAALTWTALAVEIGVAVAFAAMWRRRHIMLAAFAIPTYLLVPVAGFGATLMVLGAATASADQTRAKYAIAFFLLVLWSVSWRILFG